jgi:hypothetical protein
MTLQKRFDYPKIALAGLLAGFAVAVISWSIQFGVQYLFPYNMLELGGMRPFDDPLMALFFIHPWVIGFTMAAVYPFFTKLVESEDNRPMMYALMVWIVSAIPQFFIIFSTMNYPVGFYANQLIGSFLYTVAAAYVIWKVLD